MLIGIQSSQISNAFISVRFSVHLLRLWVIVAVTVANFILFN
jgi:hypothetical protein